MPGRCYCCLMYLSGMEQPVKLSLIWRRKHFVRFTVDVNTDRAVLDLVRLPHDCPASRLAIHNCTLTRLWQGRLRLEDAYLRGAEERTLEPIRIVEPTRLFESQNNPKNINPHLENRKEKIEESWFNVLFIFILDCRPGLDYITTCICRPLLQRMPSPPCPIYSTRLL